jgi:hypothetical protein
MELIPFCKRKTEAALIAQSDSSSLDACLIERRADGAVLVRVPSSSSHYPPLPDAVFTFRAGDPQFDYWHQRWSRQKRGAKAERN